MKEVKLKRYDVFATQLVDCVIEIQAETKDDVKIPTPSKYLDGLKSSKYLLLLPT